MMAWVTVDAAYVISAMPAELLGPYNAWIAGTPEKAERLAAIARGVVSDFRTGLKSNPTVVMALGADELPERAVRHALNIVFYNLALEMGLTVNYSALQAFVNAEIYARQLYGQEAMIDPERLSDAPSYRGSVPREARALA